MKILTFILFTILSTSVFAQEVYYQTLYGKDILNSEEYENMKREMKKDAMVDEAIIKTIYRNDSIINISFLMSNTSKDSEGNFFDVFANQKKLAGQHFPIEKFKMNGTQIQSDYIEGKPTFINFWFTNCPPCIEEVPVLNSLRKDFDEKVNFIAITFENEDLVNRFLSKKNFDFEHIVNAKDQIDEMEISAYPTSFILNEKGDVVFVTGDVSGMQMIINDILKVLL